MVCTGILMQPRFSQEIQASKYKILLRTSTCMRDSSIGENFSAKHIKVNITGKTTLSVFHWFLFHKDILVFIS